MKRTIVLTVKIDVEAETDREIAYVERHLAPCLQASLDEWAGDAYIGPRPESVCVEMRVKVAKTALLLG